MDIFDQAPLNILFKECLKNGHSLANDLKETLFLEHLETATYQWADA